MDDDKKENKVLHFNTEKQKDNFNHITNYLNNLLNSDELDEVFIGGSKADKVILMAPEDMDPDDIINLCIDIIYMPDHDHARKKRGLEIYEDQLDELELEEDEGEIDDTLLLEYDHDKKK